MTFATGFKRKSFGNRVFLLGIRLYERRVRLSRQQILVDYENLSYILRTIEDEHSSVCDTEAYRYMRAQLKANKENSFLKKLRAIIKADPTPANVQRWYQMH